MLLLLAEESSHGCICCDHEIKGACSELPQRAKNLSVACIFLQRQNKISYFQCEKRFEHASCVNCPKKKEIAALLVTYLKQIDPRVRYFLMRLSLCICKFRLSMIHKNGENQLTGRTVYCCVGQVTHGADSRMFARKLIAGIVCTERNKKV